MYHQTGPDPHQILSQAILTGSCKQQIGGDMLINTGKMCTQMLSYRWTMVLQGHFYMTHMPYINAC